MGQAVNRGCLVIADIGGYTKFLTGTELEHSHDILADLIGIVAKELSASFQLAKLEGDAVFCFETGASDGLQIISTIEACYYAFRRRLLTIDIHTNCECNACRSIPSLDLKFLLHHGQFVRHEVAGSKELVGGDVILIHRLLKNRITEATGVKGYLFMSKACADHFEVDPDAMGASSHAESFEDVGEVPGYVFNLDARWKEESERDVCYLGPEEGTLMADDVFPAPPAVVWEYMTSPDKRKLWQPGVLRVEQNNPSGTRGVGTTNHCIHGKDASFEEIIDWRPFRYFTYRGQMPMGEFVATNELQPTDEGTRVIVRWKAEGKVAKKLMLKMATAMIRSSFKKGTNKLMEVLSEQPQPEGAATT